MKFGLILALLQGLIASGAWSQVTLESTNLPLVVIDTEGQSIPDEPKVNVSLKIIHHEASPNFPSDPGNEYAGMAGIEIRGAYSASLPQKPYGFETRYPNGDNLNVPILGMPEENDWILLANYNDKVFMRNILAFHLFEKMGHYAPRAHLCEVIKNGQYEGIYVLTEKIKRDKNRVDIAKLDADDTAGDSLTGGYIFKIDYPTPGSWISPYQNPNYPGRSVYFIPEYPKERDIKDEQFNYIKETVIDFEDVLWGPDFKDPQTGYRQYIDIESFIDYFLVSEFSRNVDGYKKSRRFFKDKDSKDALIYAGPVWDFDWAYKDQNSAMLDGVGWRYNFSGNSDVKPPGWYIRLLQDPWFANRLNARYTDLKESIFDLDYLNAYIDSVAAYVDEAQERHYRRWPILGVNVGTPEVGMQPQSFQGEVNKFKMWIRDRMSWLNVNMPGDHTAVSDDGIHDERSGIRCYPNPSTDYVMLESDKEMKQVRILDINGKLVRQISSFDSNSLNINTSQWIGAYIVEVSYMDGMTERKMIITQ